MSCFTAYQPRFPLELLINNPVTEHLAESKEERISTWVGRDTHTNFMALPKPQGLMVFVTHEDDGDRLSEPWSQMGRMKDMLQNIENWDPICRVAVDAIPKESLTGWELL
ncbi:hypothetical protein AUP68_07182 [Ilyonectria robusta]